MNETRTSRFTEEEYGIFKSLFGQSDELLYLMRKAMMFGGLNETEIDQLKAVFSKEEAFNAVRKTFIPEITPNDPITQVTDLWAMVDLANKMPDEIEAEIQARKRVNEKLNEAIERLRSPSSEALDLISFDPSEDPMQNHIALKARNLFINGITIQFANLRLMAKRDAENPDEAEKRRNQNSSK